MHATCSVHTIHPNNIWRSVQIMKPFVIRFPPDFWLFVSRSSSVPSSHGRKQHSSATCGPQWPVFIFHELVFLALCTLQKLPHFHAQLIELLAYFTSWLREPIHVEVWLASPARRAWLGRRARINFTTNAWADSQLCYPHTYEFGSLEPEPSRIREPDSYVYGPVKCPVAGTTAGAEFSRLSSCFCWFLVALGFRT
jgi:hypothetical protein